MSEESKLSLVEKLELVPAFVSIGFAASRAAIEWPFRPTARADRLYHHIVHALIRKSSSRLSARQLSWIEGSFQQTYEDWCKKKSLPVNIVTISEKTKGFWLGDPASPVILVFFHGGGFVFDGNQGHISFWHSIRETLKDRGKSLAILLIAYPLTPQAVFPSQLEEAVNAINYVLHDLKRSPSQVLFGGDSAGGNITAAVMYHAMHPLESVRQVAQVNSKNKFRGVVLISPWVNFDVSLESFARNGGKDYLQADTEREWSHIYVGKSKSSAYNEPALARPDEWKGLLVDSVLVTAGTDEVLIDGIVRWVNDIQAHNSNVSFVNAMREPHEASFIWPMFGDRHETETGRGVETWLYDRL